MFSFWICMKCMPLNIHEIYATEYACNICHWICVKYIPLNIHEIHHWICMKYATEYAWNIRHWICMKYTPLDVKHQTINWSSFLDIDIFTLFCLIFQLYYQARLTWKGLLLLRPLLQLFMFCLAYYTGLSRIFDYKHHWSDVLCGDILGVIVAIATVSIYRL